MSFLLRQNTHSRQVIVWVFVGFLNFNNIIILKDQQIPVQLPARNMMFYWAKQRISMRVGVFVWACPAEVSTKCAYAYVANVHDHFVSLHLKRDHREPPSTKLTCETRANAGCRIYIRTKPCSGKAKSSNEDGYGQVSSHLARNGDPSRLGKWILKSLLYLCPVLQLWRGGRSNNSDEATHATNSRNMAR